MNIEALEIYQDKHPESRILQLISKDDIISIVDYLTLKENAVSKFKMLLMLPVGFFVFWNLVVAGRSHSYDFMETVMDALLWCMGLFAVPAFYLNLIIMRNEKEARQLFYSYFDDFPIDEKGKLCDELKELLQVAFGLDFYVLNVQDSVAYAKQQQ